MNSGRRDQWLLPALLALAVILTAGTAGWGVLYNETDGQYAGAALVMAEGGSWLVPENNGIPRLVKPPLLYWLMAASMKAFGPTEWAARLPGCLAAAVWCGVTFLWGQRMGGPWRGFMAGGILLTALGTFTLGRIVMPEPIFVAAIACALYGFYRSAEEGRARVRWQFVFWGAAAVACLTKGWHGWLYPSAIAGLAAWVHPPARGAFRELLLSWRGMVLFLVVNVPWHWEMERRFPGYFHNLIWTEHWGHLVGSDAPASAYENVPRFQFVLLHLAWFFPWSLLAVAAVWKRRKELPRRKTLPTTLVVAWAAVVVGSVLVSGQRQDYYAMTAWPAFALMAAWVLDGFRGSGPGWVLAAVLAAALIALVAFSSWAGGALPVHTAPLAERATAWTTLTQLGPEVWRNLRGIGLAAISAALAASAAGIVWYRRGCVRAGFLAMLACAVAIDLGAAAGYARVAGVFSLADLVPVLRPDEVLVFEGGMDTGSSLLFYARRSVLLVNQDPREEFAVRTTGKGREKFLSEADLVAAWNRSVPLAFIIERDRLEYWRNRLGPGISPAASCGTQVLIRNFP